MNRYNKLKRKALSVPRICRWSVAWAKGSGGATRFCPPALGLDLLQKTMEIWPTGKAIRRQRNLAVQDQRGRSRTSPLVAFATGLTPVELGIKRFPTPMLLMPSAFLDHQILEQGSQRYR